MVDLNRDSLWPKRATFFCVVPRHLRGLNIPTTNTLKNYCRLWQLAFQLYFIRLMQIAPEMKLLVILSVFMLGVWAQGPFLNEQITEDVTLAIGDENSHISDNTCWDSLSCSFADIESMEMKNRLQFVKHMGTRRFAELASADQFRAVEGVMSFFIRRHVAPSGSWMSTINAAVIEAFERGAAMSLGLSNETGGNPAAVKWQDFFDQRARGHLTERSVSKLAFARCSRSRRYAN